MLDSKSKSGSVLKDEPAEETLRRRLEQADTSDDEFTAYRKYSDERCAELNKHGHSWDCPTSSVGLKPSAEALKEAQSSISGLLDELDLPDCRG